MYPDGHVRSVLRIRDAQFSVSAVLYVGAALTLCYGLGPGNPALHG
jgi:hypothetical protein